MKIDGKNYFTFNQVLKTNNKEIILQYIENTNIKIVGKKQDKLVDMAIKQNDGNFISLLAYNFQDISHNNLDKLTDAVVKSNISEYIYEFSISANNLSNDNKNKLTEGIINAITYNRYILNNKKIGVKYVDEIELIVSLERFPEALYIYRFALNVKGLSEENIIMLMEAILKTGNIDYIGEFYNHVIPYSPLKTKAEKYVLENFTLPQIAKFLKIVNNRNLINLIFNDYKSFEQYCSDYQNFKDNIHDMKLNSNYSFSFEKKSSVRKTSGFISNDILKGIYKEQQQAEALNLKYKYVDDNIKNILKSDCFNKK